MQNLLFSRGRGTSASAIWALLIGCFCLQFPPAGRAQTTNAATPAESAEQSTGAVPRSRDEPQTLQTVTVTGSRLRGMETAAESSAPIAIISADQLQSSGAQNIEEYFQKEPEFMLSGQSSFSNAGPGSFNNATTIGSTTLNLRGIGPQYTLVLLNGQRFQSEDPANLDMIPLDSIERIEVLKSGASAIYGSDAVAGVVNIITKRQADGGSLSGTFGQSGYGDDGTTRGSASWGMSSDRLNLFTNFEYYQRNGLVQGQRSLSANPDLSRFNSNFNYFPFSYSALAQVILPDGTGPLVLDQTKFTCGDYSRNPADYVPLNPHLYATSCDPKFDEDRRSLVNPEKRGSFITSLDYKLSDATTFYSDLVISRILVQSVALNYGADGYGDPNSSYVLSPIPANYYWNPFGEPIVGVTYGFPEAGNQTYHINTTSIDWNLGIKGGANWLHYDVDVTLFSDHGNSNQFNLATNAGLYAAEQRPGAAAINLFCNVCNTPAQLAGVFSGASTLSDERMALLNASATATVATIPAGSIDVAFGTEIRRDTLEVTPAQFILENGLNDVASTATSASRNYYAGFVEAKLPVFGNNFTFPGAASLEIDAAARVENIQGSGSSTDPTVSVRWEPIARNLALRGSYGTSFRAPALTAVAAPQNTSEITLINPATGAGQNYISVVGGNPQLKPETSSYVTYGVVFTPQFFPGFTAIVDHWRISQKEVVILTNPQLVLEGIQPGSTFTAPNGQPGIVSLFENAAGQDVAGTDFDLDYRLQTARAGKFDFRVYGTRYDYFDVNDQTGTGFVNYAGGVALASTLPSVTGMPKLRAGFATNWDYRAISATYILHYTGYYVDPTIPGGVSVHSYTTQDIQLGYDFGKSAPSGSWLSRLALAVGVNDFTNSSVPIFYAGPIGYGIGANGYDTSIVDPVGRFFYGSFRLKLGKN